MTASRQGPTSTTRAPPGSGEANGRAEGATEDSDLLYRPIRARVILAGLLFAYGAIVRGALGLPLGSGYFLVVALWAGVSAGALWKLVPSRDRREFFLARLLLFGFEVVAAVWLARFLAASSWPAVLLVLLPGVEWNLIFPGWRGLAGAVGAVLAAGAIVLGETLGFVPSTTVLPSIETRLNDRAYAAATFLLAVLVIVALARVAGRYAEAARSKNAELEGAYDELGRTQADLINSARLASLGDLVRGVAHEINTPLGALSSNHDTARRALERLQVILADEVVEPDELDEVRRIVRVVDGIQSTSAMAVERMERVVRDLRTFGRPDRAEIDRVDLHEILESTLHLLDHELAGRVSVEKDFGPVPPVECHPHRLGQVFMNLLVNALHAIDGEGRITVTTRRRTEDVEIRIADTGRGIPSRNLERIFEPGFTTKGSRIGMGMGLLISSRIVEEHGGTISVESTLGEGTTFTVVLPLRMRTLARPTPETSS